MEERQKQNILQQQEESQEPVVKKQKKKTIPTRFGSLIILLAATIAGAGVWWYSFSYEPPVVDWDSVIVQLQARRAVVEEKNQVFSICEIREDRVYYGSELIEGADVETFVGLRDWYAKDKNSVYYKGNLIESADPKTFEVYYSKFQSALTFSDAVSTGGFAQDVNQLYKKGEVVEGFDINKLEFLLDDDDFYGFKDDTSVYFKMFDYSIDMYTLVLLENTDATTFEYVSGKRFARDKYNIYYQPYDKRLELLTVSADTKTFELFRNLWGKDKNHVYYGDRIQEEFDADTFEFINTEIIKDKDYVYYTSYFAGDSLYKKVEGADPINCTADNLDGCRGTE